MPFHCSANGRVPPEEFQPTAVQSVVVGQATPNRTALIAPFGMGTCWGVQLVPFQCAAIKVELPWGRAGEAPTAVHSPRTGQDTLYSEVAVWGGFGTGSNVQALVPALAAPARNSRAAPAKAMILAHHASPRRALPAGPVSLDAGIKIAALPIRRCLMSPSHCRPDRPETGPRYPLVCRRGG